MPARTRPLGAATGTEVMARDDPQALIPGLQFNEPLSWRAGKAIPVADLLRRLQALSGEMREMEQEENDKESFTKVAKELASLNLLNHKDKGVRACTAACLVDILRLCAPDAPYTGQQLREIFYMIITSILPALSDPSHAYNNQHIYVLQSLAQVKSIVLLTDLPSSEPLITSLFTTFFDILADSHKSSTEEQLGKNVEHNMTSILVIMVDESTVLPSQAVDIVVAQFLRTDPHVIGASGRKGKKHEVVVDNKQSLLVLKELPPAYNMAKTICNSCPEKMAREVSKYFNDVIIDASTTSGDHSHRKNNGDYEGSDEQALGPTEEDLKELRKAHRLLRELWRASPSVLQNVIPQLEAELSAENVHMRLLATETLGDMVSGIGAAGPPQPPAMDPAAYPPIDLSNSVDGASSLNLLIIPSSPQPFPQAHSHAYSSFLSRRQDKSPIVRSAWTTAIGRILATSAGGVGLTQVDEERLVEDLARMLNDSDEKVRLSAVKAVGEFRYRDMIDKLAPSGSIDTPGSVLGNLSERVKDRKQLVRVEAMTILGKIWGVAIGEMSAGNERIIALLKGAPSKILNAFYVNDLEIKALLDHVFHECLLPLAYPPIKVKAAKLTNGNSQKGHDSQTIGNLETETPDPDKIRAERMLILANQLDERAKKVLFAFTSQQAILSRYFGAYLQSCEDYNGGVMDKDEDRIKERLSGLISNLAKLLPDASKASADLWKFAKMHDRRSYQLIRFCMAPESDYRTLFKALKELTKRIESSPSAPAGLMETLTPLLYRTGIILYNKSHVPAILYFAKTDEKGLGSIAHEVLKDISTRTPEVLKAHILSLCSSLQEDAPTDSKLNDPGAVDNLKACSAFVQKFPADAPQDRKFLQAMTNFAVYGSPPEAAKYAVSILMATSQRRMAQAEDLMFKCVKDFEYGSAGFLSRLAALSQLCLLAPAESDANGDGVIDIAIKTILLRVRDPSTEPADAYSWSSSLDDECAAKCWALKILTNRLRSHPRPDTLAEVAEPIYTLLLTLISKEGELSTAKDTPPTHKSRLRLLASRLFLKLSTAKPHEALLTASAFNRLAEVAQDALYPVRSSFLQRLRKYLTQTRLPSRFYTIPFLLAFEPDASLKSETITWIKSRGVFFSSVPQTPQPSLLSATAADPNPLPASKVSALLESVFSRFLSLLAHHPDYESSTEDLIDFGKYILFYLTSVGTEANISLIFHIAQRVKGCRDVVSSTDTSDDFSKRLYTLSDLAQLAIHLYIEAHGWSLQTLPTFTKLTLPRSLFKEIGEHDVALDIAEKNFLPDGVREGVEGLVKMSLRKERDLKSGRKRKSEAGEDPLVKAKRAKATKGLAIGERKAVKTPKKRGSGDAEDWEEGSGRGMRETVDRRKSGRVSGVSYAERNDSEDDKEMEELNLIVESRKMAKDKGQDDGDHGHEESALPEVEEDEMDVADEKQHTTEEPGGNPVADNPNVAEQDDEDVEGEEEAQDELCSPPSAKSKPKLKAESKAKASPKYKGKGKPTASSKAKTKAVPIAEGESKARATAKSMVTRSPNTLIEGRATRSARKTAATAGGMDDSER